MKKPTKSMTLLSAMVLGVAAGQAQAEPTAKIQSLQLLKENRISYDEFKEMLGESFRPSLSQTVTSGNYGNTVTSGNYANTVTSANYADTITSANYANTVTSGNYGITEQELRDMESLPMPLGAGK